MTFKPVLLFLHSVEDGQSIGNTQRLFVVRPHPDHFHSLFFFQNLIYEAVLNVDSAGIGPGKISYELFGGRRCLVWILG